MDLVGSAEVASMIGVSRPRLYQLEATYEDFPPATTVGGRRVWERAVIQDWVFVHPNRQTGRPKTTGR